MKNNKTKNPKTQPPGEGRPVEADLYAAPPPPSKGRIIGLDCHPDTFTAAVFEGLTPHDARKLQSRPDMSLGELLDWARENFTGEDLFLMEAGTNSFEIHRRLLALGLRAVVLESAWVGRHAKAYADNDKMAAARIALVYLAGNCPAVWVPDDITRQRRELLHVYQKAVADHVAATNSLKSYLSQAAVRPGRRDLSKEATRSWILARHDWSPLQRELLADSFAAIDTAKERRKRMVRLIGREVACEPLMLRCMELLGVGMVNAFALIAIIGDIRRFETPRKLAAYLGLNPGRRESGRGKSIKLGVGKRGRGDMRRLLIQGAQAVLRMGRHSKLGQWGMKLLLRKGSRNVAVAAVARKLATQVWHLLKGNPPTALEPAKSLAVKINKLAVTLGKALRKELGFPPTLADATSFLYERLKTSSPPKLC